MNKQEKLVGWLDKQYEYHSKNKGISEEITAAVMRQTTQKIKIIGWEETLKFVKNEYSKSIDSQLRGVYAMAQAYFKVLQKMKSLNMKEISSKRDI